MPTWCSGVDHGVFEDILENHKNLNGSHARHRSRAPTTGTEIIADYKEAVEREHRQALPAGHRTSSCGAPSAPCSAPGTTPAPRPIAACTAFPTSWGTAVNVQAMVFGNIGDTLRDRRRLHAQSSTGAKELYGEFLINAQGEDVVAGIRTPQPLTEAARRRRRARPLARRGDAGDL